jgi:predicted GIY-YIG superfamily endonuclease
MATTNIYILQLQGGKYYVGKSDNPTKRFQEHLDGNGSAWTRKYRPISIEKVIPNASSFDEDRYTKEYMMRYGINNVRGGTYVTIQLDKSQEGLLKREIWGAQNRCIECGSYEHYVANCTVRNEEPNILDIVDINILRNRVSSVLGAVSDMFGFARDIVKPDTQTPRHRYFQN